MQLMLSGKSEPFSFFFYILCRFIYSCFKVKKHVVFNVILPFLLNDKGRSNGSFYDDDNEKSPNTVAVE